MKNSFLKKILRHIKWIFISAIGYIKINKNLNKNTYVFISHNADVSGGAPVVLLELVKSLKLKYNYNVIFVSEKPGKLINECEKHNIPFYVCYGLKHLYLNKFLKKQVAAIEINTIVLHKYIKILNKYNSRVPILWWIHEEKNIINKYKDIFDIKFKNDIKIMCVSNRVKENIIKNAPKLKENIRILFYGCEDFYNENSIKKYNDMFKVAVVGRICQRKNQIQILEAYNLLEKEIKEKIFIRFIFGSSDKNYEDNLKKIVTEKNIINNVSFEGPYNRQEMIEIYENSNLVICSSIEDPLPVVVTESLMLKCPVITSSATGQYELIENGINGYKYDVCNVEELKDNILKVYYEKNIDKLTNNGRKLYLKEFSIDKCCDKFIEILLN